MNDEFRAMVFGLNAVDAALSEAGKAKACVEAFRPLAVATPKLAVSDVWGKVFNYGLIELTVQDKLQLLEDFVEEYGLVSALEDEIADRVEVIGYDMDGYRREIAD